MGKRPISRLMGRDAVCMAILMRILSTLKKDNIAGYVLLLQPFVYSSCPITGLLLGFPTLKQ